MKNWFGFVAAALSICVMPSLAAFSESSFNYGAMWEGIKDRSDRASLGLSHVAMYIGDANTQWSDRVNQPYNPYWEADMVKFCAQNDITPVFYAYVIAEWDKHLGYSDCDVGSPNHCTNGAATIRRDWNTILWRYGELAKGVASDMGSKKNTIPSIWLIEPDFYQYSVSGDNQRGGQQSGGGIPDADLAGTKFNQIVAAIKQHLPNAKIAVDISPWISNPQGWYSNFDASKIDYMFTSGGRTEGNNTKIRSENNMTWAQASGFLGKKIIADDGYGVGGGAEENYSDWQNVNNLKSRISDGVIGLTIKSPSASFMNWTKQNPLSISSGNSGNSSSSSARSSSSSAKSSSSQWQGGISSPWQGGISSPWLPSSSSQGTSGGSAFAITTANLIDDFEDGDSTAYTGTNDTWFAFTDSGDKGASSLTNAKNATGYNVVFAADNGSKYMAGLKGITLNQGSNPYDPYVTLGLDINGGLKNCKTISYKYKGAGHNLKAVTKGDEDGVLSEYNYHKAAVGASTSWQTKTVAASAMAQEAGWGKTFALNASNIVKLQWEVKGTATSNYLYVDDVACDGMSIVRPASSSSSAKSSSSVASSSSIQSSSSAKSSSSVASSSSVTASGSCIAYVAGTGGYADHCYSSGLTGMAAGKCYTMNPARDPKTQWVNNNAAETYWWVETSCGEVPTSSSAASSSSVAESSSSVPVVTTFVPSVANTVQNIVAGQAIEPIVYRFENVKSISVTGLPKGLNGVLNETAKTYTISGTVDASLGDHDYAYTVTVTGVDENATATGTIKVSHKPVVTVFDNTSANSEQNVVAGQAITPIVYRYENMTGVSVDGLPKGLAMTKNDATKTITISGTIDAELGTHDYAYTVSVTGVDENKTATGVIHVTRAPVVTVFDNTSANSEQNVVAGQAITPIVYRYENMTSVSVDGLPKGLSMTKNESAKTITISGTIDAELGTHDYEYTVNVTGVDENKAATGVIHVTRAPVVTVFDITSANSEQNVVAGQAITPIVYRYENMTSVSVDGLPKGLSMTKNDAARTITISGTVDAELGSHDYAYTVSVTGVDENKTATGVIHVTRAPVVTVFDNTSANSEQNVIAGQAITPIVYRYENMTSVSVDGLPKGLSMTKNDAAKTISISGTIDAELGTHDYEYTVNVTGVDENKTATGVIHVTRAPVVTTIALTSNNANQNVVAGNAIEPIVYRYENAIEVSVEGLPLGLSGALDQLANTYVISGTVDEKLSTHDYDYAVTFFGVDENKTATGSIKVLELEISSSSEIPLQSSSSEEPELSSSSIEVSSSSVDEISSSSEAPEVSSSSVQPQSSSSEEPELSSSSIEVSSSSVDEISSSSEAPEVSSSSEEANLSSSSEEYVSSSSEVPEVSSSSEIPPQSSSSEEPELSSSSIEVSSSSVDEISSSSEEPVVSSSSEETNLSSSSEEYVSSSSEVPEFSSSSEIPPQSSSSEEPAVSSSSVQPPQSSSSEEPADSSSSEEPSDSSSSSEDDGTELVVANRTSFNIGFARNVLTLASSRTATYKIQIFDMMGHAVASQKEDVSGSFSMNLDHLNRGNYLVRISSGSEVRTSRIAIR